MRVCLFVVLCLALGCGGEGSGAGAGAGATESAATATGSAATATGSDSSGAVLPVESSSSGPLGESSGEPSPCTEVHAGDLVLEGQADNEALSRLREVQGNVTITGDVTCLEGLGCLETIRGSLLIQRTQGLHSLAGLDRLAEIGDVLWVTNNADLESLEGLTALRFVAVIRLGGNRITSLGLSQLQAVDTIAIGDCFYDGTHATGEPLLEDFDGLQSLLAVVHVQIYDAPMLRSLSGLEAFAERGGALGLLTLWRNAELDPAAVADVVDASVGLNVDACGNQGEPTDACSCGPPP